jgi:Holliday junction resolvase RusA-like endonuclease
VRTYKDPAQTAHESAVLQAIAHHIPREPLRGPVLFGLKAFFEPPQSWSKAKRADALAGKIRPVGRPDLDNCCKNCDIFTGRFWLDDSQIVEFLPGTGKYYGTPARYEIEIFPL